MNDESGIPKTLYELLGATPGATRAEIKAAYETSVACMQQRVENGELEALDELRLLRDAFHILYDAERRARYDAWIKPQYLQAETAKNKEEAEAAARETVSWGIVLLLFALALASVGTCLTLLESAIESPVEFAEPVRTGRR